MSRNHDYFTRPVRSDRMLHDYGNTRLTPSEPPATGRRTLLSITLAVVVLSAVYAYAVMGG